MLFMVDITIKNKHGEFTVRLDDEDYKELKVYKWCVAKTIDRYVTRAYIPETQKYVALHTLIMKPDKGLVVDHINHNPLDNRRSNLRTVTQHQNTLNSIRRNTFSTPYVGVYAGSGGFKAEIRKGNVVYQAHWFKTPEEARDVHRKLLAFLIGKEAADAVDNPLPSTKSPTTDL